MKRDKFIIVQRGIFTVGETGGSRTTWASHWTGWANVEEMTYTTAMEESQWTGNKTIRVNIRKFPVTEKINSTMRIIYRGQTYLINSKVELDRFTYQIMASVKELNELEVEEPTIENALDTNLNGTL